MERGEAMTDSPSPEVMAELTFVDDPAGALAATLANFARKHVSTDDELANLFGEFQTAIDAFLLAYAARVRKEALEEAASLADKHAKRPGAKIKRGFFATDEQHSELVQQVLSEERGEKIAAVEIAKTIRAIRGNI